MTNEKSGIPCLCENIYRHQYYYAKVFLLCLLTACATIVPFIWRGHGIFTVVDDFNYQQFAFNIASNQAIKSGEVFWSWYTDLGSDFIGSFSFYTLGSPFFWLSLLFAPSFFPYLVGPLLILKYCVAGLTSFAFIARFVRNKDYAVIGALLYAFSSFQTGNLMFNHFHDVAAFFPLLLIGLEEIIEHKKYGCFALTMGLNALINYFFFIGEVIFIALYFCIRWLIPDFKRTVRFVPKCLFEGAAGVGLAAVLFIPSVLFTLNNPRSDRFIYGAYAAFFDPSRYLALLKSVLLPADMMADPVTQYGTGYSSCFAYLPLVGISLVVVYLLHYKSDWLSRIAKACAVIACIPILNSVFYGLNEMYYARWFYMPLLMFALMSAIVIERRREIPTTKGLLVTGVFLILLVLFSAVYPWTKEIESAVVHGKLFALYVLAAAGGLLITKLLLLCRFSDKQYCTLMIAFVVLVSVSLGFVNIYKQQQLKWENQNPTAVYNTVVKRALNIKLPDEQNYRISMDLNYYNFAMMNQTPSINSFTSTLEGSIFEFYDALGIDRNVISTPKGEGIKPLLSVKYDVTAARDGQRKEVSAYDDGTATTYVYERADFIPLGFTYNYYVFKDGFLSVPEDVRSRVLLKAVVLADEQTAAASGLRPLPEEEMNKVSAQDMLNDISERKKESSVEFRRSSKGFEAVIGADAHKLAYFSVPYNSAWKASVNGKRVDVINSLGMMAVRVEAGENVIQFKYEPFGLKLGIIVFIASAMVLACYRVIFWRKSKKAMPSSSR